MNENELERIEMIEQLLTAEVITLAKQIKDEKKSKGIHTTSDCIADAVKEIKIKRKNVISALKK